MICYGEPIRPSQKASVHIHRVTDDLAIGKHIVIVIALSAGATRLSLSEQEVGHRPQSSSASRFTAGASGFFILIQSGERPLR
jgi:hypothetical protein